MRVENWDYEDFKSYLFIYCSFADHIEVGKERAVAIKKIGQERFTKIRDIILNDTDDVGINKIKKYLRINNISKEKKNDLLWDVADMFLSDGTYHKLEKRLYASLERLFEKVYAPA